MSPARFAISHALALALGGAALVRPSLAEAQSVRTDLAMTNGTINAELIQGSKLYLGGSFTNIGPATGSGVPVDTVSAQVVNGFPVVKGTIQAAVPDGAGGWFLGGSFTSVGGQARANLAHVLSDLSVAAWNPGADQAVFTLALQGGVLYAGGDFQNIGGASRSRIAAIDSSSGLALGWNPGADAGVRALAATDSVLYAGGSFLNIGGASRAHIAEIGRAHV